MKSINRRTIGVLTGYQVYGNLSDSQTIEGSSISDYLLHTHQGILDAAREMDCNILIGCGLGSPPTPEHPFPAWFNWADDSTFVPVGPWNTDGLIVLTPVISEQRQKLLQALRDDGFPVVFCGAGEAAPAVIADDAVGIREAVQHLYAHGHRRIAYIAGYEQQIEGDSAIRLKAYKSAIRQLGMAEDIGLIAYGLHTIQGGRNAMQKLVAAGQSFTAVVAGDYSAAMGCLRVLREAGRRIPDDVALIGFDDYLDARAQIPPVTTVHTQLSEMGYQSVKLLIEYLDAVRVEPVTLSVQGQLVIRRSCGCTPEDMTLTGDELPVSENELISLMAQATLRGVYSLKFAEIEAGFVHLIREFKVSLQQINKKPFGDALTALLQEIGASGDDVYILQDAISTLRRNLALVWQFESGGNEIENLADDLLDQANLRISEYSHSQAAQRLIHKDAISDALGAMTPRLVSVLDEAEIPSILAEHLPRMGISHAEIAILEKDGEDRTAWSLLWKDANGSSNPIWRFPTQDFPPLGLYPIEKAYQSVILPLVNRGEQMGYVAFDAVDLEPLAAITQQISTAIGGARLYKEAQAGRQLAEAANRLKTRFLSTVSHELRTPLNLIVGLSELLLREERQGKTPSRQDLERIYGSSRHLGLLIRDVLDLASNDAGQLRLALEPLNLNDLLETVSATGEQIVTEKGLAWKAIFDQPGPRILADRVRLEQILLNLITNAAKFTMKGSVTLHASVEGPEVVISVTDTGLGVPLNEQADIFDEFHQSERTAARGFGGMGLGLAISKHLVELHGGKIGIISSGVEGKGATLFFTLPILVEESTRLEIPSSIYSDILLLTDHPEQSVEFCKHLAEQGYSISVGNFAPDISVFLQTLDKSLSAILLDQSLAVQYGWETLVSLKRNAALQDISVLFYTLPDPEKAGMVLQLDYQTKPLPAENLFAILDQKLDMDGKTQIILLVDDDQNTLDLHTRIVQSRLVKSRIIHAHNGREALEIIRSLRPDLILLDLMMPEMDGFDVLKSLQASNVNREIPVIVLTAKVLTDEDINRLNQGVSVILEKGVFTYDETLEHVINMLKRSVRRLNASQLLVRKAMGYIHLHYGELITRDKLARHLSVSENYLTNCFQKETGIPLLTYVNRYRIKQARELLSNTSIDIITIGNEVGFSDPAHFSRVFKKETGVAPSVYRRQLAARNA